MADLDTLSTNVDPEKLRQLALLRGIGAPAGPQPLAPVDTTKPSVSPMSKRGADIAISATNSPTLKPVGGTAPEAPEIGASEQPRLQPVGNPSPVKPLSFAERQALPLVSPGTPAGSAASYQNQLERIADQKQNPWGSAENHPGTLGKIGHVLGRIGNVAGDIVAPGVMARIPETELGREVAENKATKNFETTRKEEAGEREATARTDIEKQKEASEEPLRAAQTEAVGNKDSAALAKQGLTRDKDGNIVADENSPVYQQNQQKQKDAETVRTNLLAYRQAQTDLANARTEVEKAKNDPNSPAFKAAQRRLEMAEQAHAIAGQNLQLHEEQFKNKIQEQELLKPSGQAQSRGSAAQAVIDLMPDLKNLVEKHRADMGPIMGRLNRGEIAVGNVDPEIARLYSAMKSFYALQPAVHGFRNAEFVKDFEHALGTLERNPDAFIAGMEGLKPTLESVAKEGKTFHKRVVEGGGATPTVTPETPAAGGTVPSFADFLKTKKP